MALVFSLISVLVCVYLWIMAPPMPTAKRVAYALSFPAMLSAFWLLQAEVLARPKPVALEWIRSGQMVVLASRISDGTAIYLWLLAKGETEPRYYELPWSKETAKKLQEAIRSAEKGRQLLFSLPYQKSYGVDSPFHVLPQPKLPDKMGNENPAANLPKQDI